jgi:4-nitrophenyl phosphatase
MDGTLVLGDKNNKGLKPLPGALELIHLLKERGVPYVVFTNGTPRTPGLYAGMLRDAGFPLIDEQMMTPASSAVDFFVKQKYKRVCVLGGDGINIPLRQAGIETVPPEGKPEVDAVFAGWFREFSMANLESACHAVSHGAKVYSASQSMFFATADGRSFGTSRAMSAVIRDLTGARINIIGKPSMHALRSASARLKIKLQDIVVVGDDPALEISMANRGKSLAVAVDTGIGNADDYRKLAEKDRPHLFLETVNDLLSLYR